MFNPFVIMKEQLFIPTIVINSTLLNIHNHNYNCIVYLVPSFNIKCIVYNNIDTYILFSCIIRHLLGLHYSGVYIFNSFLQSLPFNWNG